MTDILTLPQMPIDPSGPFSVYSWSVNRIGMNNAGVASLVEVETVTPIEKMIPKSFKIQTSLEYISSDPQSKDRIHLLHATHDSLNLVIQHGMGSFVVAITVYSADIKDKNQVEDLLRHIRATCAPVPPTPDDSIRTRFWRMGITGPTNSSRRLFVPDWEEIEKNYSDKARQSLKSLVERPAPKDTTAGNIIVLHGPAGTGKTTVLRALAKSWKSWADSNYIVDPDEFLHHADYMWQAVIDITSDEGEKIISNSEEEYSGPRWKLLIMEDVDELIRDGAKSQVGQSFSRLLNLGDGFLGQGQRLLIVLTTNEPVEKLAPAITRPGRCLAHIEVPKLTAKEASAWLGQQHEDATLAELYEVKAAAHQVVNEKSTHRPGQYL